MPTREELYTALRNADKAGDAEGARRLAAYIQSLPAETAAPAKASAPAKPADAGGAGATLKKMAEGAALGISDMGNTALNVLTAPIAAFSPAVAQWNRTRNADFDALTEQNKDSTEFKLGRLGGNLATTFPVGGTLAAGLARVPAIASRAAPLVNAVASGGFVTGMPAAATLGGKAAQLGIRAAGGAITGGASSALVDPEHTLRGAAISAALPPTLSGVGKVAGYAGKSLKSIVQPFTSTGQDEIAASILAKFGDGGPMTINAAQLVPGSTPTLAEATGNAGIAGLQRGARDLRPNAFVARESDNAAARLASFDGIAGDKAAIAAASAARENAANALYGQAFTADAMRRGLAQESQAMRAPFSGVGLSGAPEDLATPGLRELATRPGFKAAIDAAKRLAADKGAHLSDPLQSLEGLHYIKLALDDALNPAASTAMGRNASAAVMGMRNKLTDELAKVSPLYGNARQTFADMSQPINAMEALQELRLTNAAGNMTLVKVQNALGGLERARGAPGVDPAKSITAEQMNALSAIRDDLLRQDALGAGRSAGSNTFQNIATNNILTNLLPGKLGVLAEQKAGGVVGQAGRLLYSGPNEAIRNRLVDMLLDPAAAEQALARQQAIGGQSALERFLENPKFAQPVLRIAPPAASEHHGNPR